MNLVPLPVAKVYRDGLVESVHRGSIAVVDTNGDLLYFLGDFKFPTIMRSCAKPFQALPLIDSGAADRFGLTESEIAVTTGSISGRDFQREAVRSILEKIGLSESSLRCGTHRPFHTPTAKKLDQEGKRGGPLHNSCAGKHAGMLATCVFKKWPVDTYDRLNHPLQQWVLDKVAQFTAVPRDQIPICIDGCGLPTFQVPLKNLALSFARLADTKVPSVARLMDCARKHPEMIAGENRICTDLMRATQGRVFGKIGGEAVYGMIIFEKGWGISIKIEDGSLRGLTPTVIEILKKLGSITERELQLLEVYHHPKVINCRKEEVGTVSPAVDFRTAEWSPEKASLQEQGR